jgi:hypothetical protein
MAKAAKKKAEHVRPDWELMHDTRDNPDFSRDHEEGKYGNPRRISVVVNVRESAVSTLAARGLLNEAQVEAADKFRRLFERMGGSGARAIDWRKEAVDGGRFPDPIGVAQIDAGKQLAAAYEDLVKQHGVYAWKLVSYVCGDGYSIHELTETRRQRDTMTDNLRGYLDVLAGHWNLMGRKVSR